MAASRKSAKYASLSAAYLVQPIALELWSQSTNRLWNFLSIWAKNRVNDKEGQFLFQRLSIALQCFNAILLHESFDGL